MFLFYFSVALAGISSVLYHIFQKLTPSDANPGLALAVTYSISFVLCLVMVLTLYPLKAGLAEEFRKLNWASVALGGALIGLELGALLAYRAGWNLSLASIAINTLAALLLFPIGLLVFKEKLSITAVIGVIFCLVGLILVNWKK